MKVQNKRADMEGITCAEPKDYDDIQRFLEDAYGHTYNFFSNNYPTVHRKENTDWQHIYLIKEGDRIASLVRICPLKLVLGKATVNLAGIGSVATSPSVRGKGYMSQLMNYAMNRMKKEGFAVSILRGDRHRYQTFGYENAGKTIHLQITGRGLQKTGIKPLLPQRYSGQRELLGNIVSAYEKHTYRKERTKNENSLLYSKPGVLLFCSGEEEMFGYLALAGECGQNGCLEFGGNSETVLGITAYVMERFGISSISFPFPDKPAVPNPVLEAASGWTVTSSGMVKIVDLEKTLSLFRPQTEEGYSLERLKNIPETEQVEALFGTLSKSPFNIFVWSLDHI